MLALIAFRAQQNATLNGIEAGVTLQALCVVHLKTFCVAACDASSELDRNAMHDAPSVTVNIQQTSPELLGNFLHVFFLSECKEVVNSSELERSSGKNAHTSNVLWVQQIWRSPETNLLEVRKELAAVCAECQETNDTR